MDLCTSAKIRTFNLSLRSVNILSSFRLIWIEDIRSILYFVSKLILVIFNFLIFYISNRLVLKAANSSWVLPLWRKGAPVCILIHFRTLFGFWCKNFASNFVLTIFLFFPFLGPMSQHLVGPGPWMNPIQYFYCSCCTPAVGAMAPPPTIIDGSSQVTNSLLVIPCAAK